MKHAQTERAEVQNGVIQNVRPSQRRGEVVEVGFLKKRTKTSTIGFLSLVHHIKVLFY